MVSPLAHMEWHQISFDHSNAPHVPNHNKYNWTLIHWAKYRKFLCSCDLGEAMLLASDWSCRINWPGYWPLIDLRFGCSNSNAPWSEGSAEAQTLHYILSWKWGNDTSWSVSRQEETVMLPWSQYFQRESWHYCIVLYSGCCFLFHSSIYLLDHI